jgi:glycosyltransferase involved in cell wall biosynthesis
MGHPIHVVYGGFDMERFRPALADAQRQTWGLHPANYVFAVIGGYAFPRGKGQPEFLRAAALIHQQVPQARFLLIGRGNMKEMLENEIRRLGLEGVAWLTPYSHDMPAAMNAIDCLVLPQVGTEAIPGVVIEAHACGKPVIASDLDGISEAFEVAGCGRLVQRGSVPALAEAMSHWASQKPLEMAARLEMHRKVANQFSLERAAAELSKLYRSLGTIPEARD